MIIDLSQISPNQVYHCMTQTLIPRPIAWVLSENPVGGLNLAPFSYFNGVCSEPPLIMLSIGKKPDGAPKDTRANIEARRHFVVHIPHWEMMKEMNDSAVGLPADQSEVERLGLAVVEQEGFVLPRLADCRVAYACTLHGIQEIGAAPQALIFGRIDTIYLDDAIARQDAKGRLEVDAGAIDPIGRLGGGEYANLGQIVFQGRPGS